MKILVVFRGGFRKRKIESELICRNIYKNIFKPLLENNHQYDIIFQTYNFPELEIFKSNFKPLNVYITDSNISTQIINFNNALDNVNPIYENYDHIIFLRFEIIYKKPIFDSNILNIEGLILPYKEDSESLFKSHEYYSDIIICISKKYFMDFYDIVNSKPSKFTIGPLHEIGKVCKHKIPINCIIDGYWQSSTGWKMDDPRLSPLFILTHHPYPYSDNEMKSYLNS